MTFVRGTYSCNNFAVPVMFHAQFCRRWRHIRVQWLRFIRVACVVTVLCPFVSLAATPASVFSSKLWQTEDGLPQNAVRAICQTPDGYLWVGTDEGVVRFDGIHFVPLKSSEHPQLEQARITALAATRDGGLCIGTEGDGFFLYLNGVFQSLTATNGLPGNTVRSLLAAKSGKTWIGTDNGLIAVHSNGIQTVGMNAGRDLSAVRALYEKKNGMLLVGAASGLCGVDANLIPHSDTSPAATFTNSIRAIHHDESGMFWLGTPEGLFQQTTNRAQLWRRLAGLPGPLITSLCPSRSGDLWVGTFGGLVRLVNGRPVAWRRDGKSLNEPVNVVFEDQEGNIWVGAKNGLHRLVPERFESVTADSGLSGNNVVSVCEDSAGALWASIWGAGLNRIAGGKISAIRATNGLSHDSVLSLGTGRDGRLWVGFDFGGGLNRISRYLTNDFRRVSDAIPTAARVIVEDRQGALWVGTSRGAIRMGDEGFTTYSKSNGLAGDTVMDICETRTGALWFATDGGLSRLADGRFDTFTKANGLSDNSVMALHEDAEGSLWIGTKNGGLNRLRAGSFSSCTVAQGLFSDEVFEIIEDDFGFLWMTCRRGLFRIAKSEFDALDRGELAQINCAMFNREDGLATAQFNGVAKPSGLKSRDGRLWFATIRGMLAVKAGLGINQHPPMAAIETVFASRLQLREPLEQGNPNDSLAVPAARRELEIHFTGLSLRAPERNLFRYRLDGVDSEWIDAGRRRFANYPDLKPGDYTFRVKAANNDGVWGATEARLQFNVQPHFWETWVFKALIAFGAAGLLLALFRIRIARLREIERLRIRIASDLHDDVGSRLTRVAMVTELMQRETPPADPNKPHLETVSGTVREITRAMDEIVWTINPRNDALDNLASYTYQYAEEYFRGSGIRCRLDFPVEIPDQNISTEDRHNLFMAFKESLNNVLKHSKASEVCVALSVENGQIIFVISDNGQGMNLAEKTHDGDGLTNIRERLRQIGGSSSIQSTPGQGTIVTLRTRPRNS
jgi:ligand-binding sensor domain-containing protein/signal transduction histidine kinase